MKAHYLLIFVFSVATGLAIACSSEEPVSTPSAAPTREVLAPTPSPSRAATPQGPSPTRTPTLRTVWLFDLEAGTRTTLTDELDRPPYELSFEDGAETVRIRYWFDGQRVALGFALDGTLLARTEVVPTCTETRHGAEIAGRHYVDAACGLISPNERWMTYGTAVEQPPEALTRGDWDQWVVNLETGESRLLQEGLRHCGGCDGRYAAEWSPSSRFLFFPEWLQSGRTFLSDILTMTTVEITVGSTEIHRKPAWSPAEDHLLAYHQDGSTFLHDLSSDVRIKVQMLGDYVRFEANGAYLYASVPDSSKEGILVYDVKEQRVAATLPGHITFLAFHGVNLPIVGTDDGFVAAFSEGGTCTGVAIYRDELQAGCVRGSGPEISPDGRKVAFRSGREIKLFDVEAGVTTILATGIEGGENPRIVWNPMSTHLLVLWPGYHIGL